MSVTTQSASASHASPHRHHVSLAAILFGLIAAPAAWSAQLITNYALAAYACYPHAIPRHGGPMWPATWTILLVINIAAIVVALSSAAVARRTWNATHAEQPGPTSHLLDAGEGRTRFLGLVGLMASLGFALAACFNTVALLAVPACLG